jgi:hypothetical protein
MGYLQQSTGSLGSARQVCCQWLNRCRDIAGEALALHISSLRLHPRVDTGQATTKHCGMRIDNTIATCYRALQGAVRHDPNHTQIRESISYSINNLRASGEANASVRSIVDRIVVLKCP